MMIEADDVAPALLLEADMMMVELALLNTVHTVHTTYKLSYVRTTRQKRTKLLSST